MATHTSMRCSALLSSATLAILCISCSCLQFNYPSFDTASKADFIFSPGTGITNASLQITPSTGEMSHRSGRVLCTKDTLKLWNRERTALTSFTTEFVLNILPQNGTSGEGMAFILTSKPSLPSNSSGQWLGIVSNGTDGSPVNQIVALEFDTRKNSEYDADGNHVGVDINGIKTIDPYPLSNLSVILSSGSDVLFRLQYIGTLALLYVDASKNGYAFSSRWAVDLSKYLMEDITVGFAASNGEFTGLHQLKSWNLSKKKR